MEQFVYRLRLKISKLLSELYSERTLYTRCEQLNKPCTTGVRWYNALCFIYSRLGTLGSMCFLDKRATERKRCFAASISDENMCMAWGGIGSIRFDSNVETVLVPVVLFAGNALSVLFTK